MAQFSRKFLIRGKVQGVWFRDSTRQEANKLNITGYAKNLLDGSVEVVACGELSALEKLEHWLHQGPPLARVVSVEIIHIEWQNHDLFSIL